MEKLFLVTNPGSSSRKYALYKGDKIICNLHFETEGKNVICTIKYPDGSKKKLTEGFKKMTDTVKYVKQILEDENYINKNTQLDAILARVAATGDYFSHDHKFDNDCRKHLEAAKKRVPLHVPIVAAEIEECAKEFKDTPIITITDSGFHNTRDDVHKYYAIDKDLADKAELKRYGYHGLSIGSIADYLEKNKLTAEKVVVCHIGSGCSITALLNNKSYDTTMGYSPLEGLMMATRCGDIDTTAALAIGRELGLEGEKLEEYLNKQCGLKGVTGETDDMREVISLRDDGDERARLAYDMYIYRIQRAIGQLVASLHGIDALVFTATIGERNAEIRHDIISGLEYLGFKINDTKNSDGLGEHRHVNIAASGSKPIYVITTDETGEMIHRALKLLAE